MRRSSRVQEQLAKVLHEKADTALEKWGNKGIKRFQTVSHPNKCRVTLSINAMFYVGPEADKKIYLYMLDNHFDLI